MEITDLLQQPQFSLERDKKSQILCSHLNDLHNWHYSKSPEYKNVCDKIFNDKGPYATIDKFPYLPVSVFKNHSLKSISDQEVFKVLTSSGTTGQAVSKIYLDKETAKLQTSALSKIITHIIGTSRLPMLIIDSKSIFANKSTFSARGAGILGLSVYGKDHHYSLDENFEPDENILSSFLEKYNGQPFLIFGFTFMVWQFLYQAALKNKYDLSNAILFHSGGWKKLTEIAVDNQSFRLALKEKFGLQQIYNFYGMVEQTGSIFIENSDGYLHCPNFADIIIRNPIDLSVQTPGKEGLIQVISLLSKSYPGHSLLTEDIGIQLGEDNASNNWKGKYFKIIGRAKKAELRGCSDTFKSK